MKMFVDKDRDVDRTNGIYSKGNYLYIGATRTDVSGHNIIADDKEYPGTKVLWELIVMRVPNDDEYTTEDYENYAEIMFKKTIWDKRRHLQGQGTIVIPNDPNALFERFDLLMASHEAGNTGIRDEIMSIADELKRHIYIDNNGYKNIISVL